MSHEPTTSNDVPRPKRRVLSFLVGSSIALVVVLGATEVGLRFGHPIAFRAPIDRAKGDEWRVMLHRASATPGLRYELVPGARGTFRQMDVSVNALGMRGPEVDAAKPAGTTRVVAMGDSVTFGWDVRAEDAWPAQLERELRARVEFDRGARAPESSTDRVEVLNCGVSGYGTRDEAIALDRRVDELAPDVVVLAYFWNDPEQIPLAPLQRFFDEPAWWQHSHLLRLVARNLYERDLRRHGGGDFYRYLHAPDGPCWPRELEAFDRLRGVVRSRVPHTLIALFPSYPKDGEWDAYPYRDLHAQVAAALAERGFDVLDLLPAFSASGHPPRELCVDTEHPNPDGHALAARAIADELTRRGWIR